jgi:hypothetical protein
MTTGSIIILVSIAFLVVMLKTYYDTGKKALSIFPDIATVKVVYRDKGATGYSTRSWKTKMGGASRAIDIIVTEGELWLSAMVFFAGITKQHDLVHKIPFKRITSAKLDKGQIMLSFRDDRGGHHQVILRTRDERAFMDSIAHTR